ncbi:GtrA family protein [Pedobacter sp. SYP-B3415]|uniref:GtrA family protein n=1 Tax=Pedobacter sp. SYP-B3415 TaxID=2496641 RepID=UPI00101CFF45|nr:GtrA family protein [Pedobacter sp. SYP-B3415]
MSKLDRFYHFCHTLLRYIIVGSSGVLIDFSCTWLLKTVFDSPALIASGLGFIIAAVTNFFVNSKWTFQEKAISRGKFYAFFLISLSGLLLSSGTILLLLAVLPFDLYICKLITLVVVFLWNFSANYLITFKRNQRIAEFATASSKQQNYRIDI